MLIITNDTGTLFWQTETKAKETLEIKLAEASGILSFDLPLNSKNGEWMFGLKILTIYKFFLNRTNENN